jgi:hypothetical protein
MWHHRSGKKCDQLEAVFVQQASLICYHCQVQWILFLVAICGICLLHFVHTTAIFSTLQQSKFQSISKTETVPISRVITLAPVAFHPWLVILLLLTGEVSNNDKSRLFSFDSPATGS